MTTIDIKVLLNPLDCLIPDDISLEGGLALANRLNACVNDAHREVERCRALMVGEALGLECELDERVAEHLFAKYCAPRMSVCSGLHAGFTDLVQDVVERFEYLFTDDPQWKPVHDACAYVWELALSNEAQLGGVVSSAVAEARWLNAIDPYDAR